ncbi:hypothetical protein HHK36_020798 [Tetracentron sinense]|uniref:Nucleolar protein 16 n=1 Tax=Tetracentron sinense TaxID=13715 RepID=A0A834YS82_TETSI|nr:hypothetical protein HHK36_020798 [Tetracentron sinense]
MGRSRRKSKNSRPKVRVGLPKKNPNVFKPAFNLPPKLRSLIDPSTNKWDDKASVLRNYRSFGVVSNPNFLGVRSRTSHIIESDSLQVPLPREKTTTIDAVSEFEPIDSGSDLEEDGVDFPGRTRIRDPNNLVSEQATENYASSLMEMAPSGVPTCRELDQTIREMKEMIDQQFEEQGKEVEKTVGELTWQQFNKALCVHFGAIDGCDPNSNLSKLRQDLKSVLGKKRRDGKTTPLQPLTTMQRIHIGRLTEKYGDDYQSMFMDTKLNAMQHSVATLEKLCKRHYTNQNKNPLILSG